MAAKIAADIETTGKVHSATISELSRGLAVVTGTDDNPNENVRAVKEMMKRAKMDRTSSGHTWDSEIKKLEKCVPKKIRKQMVAMLKGIEDAFNANAVARRIEEAPAFRSQLLRASVPDTNRLMGLMRCETTLENSSYKSLHEFQRLQAFRLGRRAHVPIAVDVLESKE